MDCSYIDHLLDNNGSLQVYAKNSWRVLLQPCGFGRQDQQASKYCRCRNHQDLSAKIPLMKEILLTSNILIILFAASSLTARQAGQSHSTGWFRCWHQTICQSVTKRWSFRNSWAPYYVQAFKDETSYICRLAAAEEYNLHDMDDRSWATGTSSSSLSEGLEVMNRLTKISEKLAVQNSFLTKENKELSEEIEGPV